MQRLTRFFDGGGFAAGALTVLAGWSLLMLGLLLAPGADSGFGAFAAEFRVWCFGAEPATGVWRWVFSAAMFGPPLMMSGFIAVIWWGPLRQISGDPAQLFRAVSVASVAVATAAALLLVGGRDAVPANTGEMPFPAELLRTAHPAPSFALVNQGHEVVDPGRFDGHVVVVTAVYASCPHTCPGVIAQVKRALETVPEAQRGDVRVIAVTLDPETDSPEVLGALADMHDLPLPTWNLVTGPPAEVNDALDQIEVARTRQPDGVIDHTSVFVVMDRRGNVAYRFSLGERQERWLGSALRLLLAEEPGLG